MHTCMCGSMPSFLLGQRLGVDLLGPVVILDLTVGGAPIVFHSGCRSSDSHQQCVGSSFPASSQALAVVRHVHPGCPVELCLRVASLCIPLMNNDIEQVFMCSLAIVCFP